MIPSHTKNILIGSSIVVIAALSLAGRSFAAFGVPVFSIIAIVLLLLPVRTRKRVTQRIVPIARESEPAIPREIQKKVIIDISNTPVSALGAEFRKRAWHDSEVIVDSIINNCLLLIKSKLNTYTVAVFFPTTDGGYKLRRHLSNSSNINTDVVLYPGLGVLGGFLKEGCTKLNLPEILNDSTTLYYYSNDEGVRSLIASPICVEGSIRGIIVADSTEKNRFSDEDHAFASTTATVLGQAVYGTYLYTEHKLEHLRLVAMSGIEKDFFNNLSLDTILDKIIEYISFALTCDRITVSMRQDDSTGAMIVRSWGLDAKRYLNMIFSLKERGLASLLFSKNIVLSRNFSLEHEEFRFIHDEPHDTNGGSFCAVPLGVDECKGMLLVESTRPDAFGSSTKELLTRIGTSAGLALEKILVLNKAKDLATHDGLTGLNNHRQFQQILNDEITRSLRYNDPLALILCDIDFFKKVNDTWGHVFGDTVLKDVASKLESSIRQNIDSAARYGGEEFALVLVKTDQEQAIDTAERIRQQIQSIPFRAPSGEEISITMSFGLAMYRIHARQIDELIKKADKALYRAKENGRNRVEVF